MDRFVAALAEPWTRRWLSQAGGAALAFWSLGVLAYLRELPAAAFRCAGAAGSNGAWCRTQHAGALGTAAAGALAGAVVVGSAYLVAACAPGLINLLAGEGWPWRGHWAAAARPMLLRLVRRQADARGRAASAGSPLPVRLPAVPPGAGARRRAHEAVAGYAADAMIDRAASARLRRYPRNVGATGPTRIGSAFAAMAERVWDRHRLDLSVCWEPILAVLPGDARESLARESTRLTSRAQNLIWASAAIGWAALLSPRLAAGWALGVVAVGGALYAGLRSAAETYCDLIEAIVAVHRGQLYQGLGLALPDSPAAEIVAGAALTAYLNGAPAAGLSFSWPGIPATPGTPAGPDPQTTPARELATRDDR